MTLIRPSYLKKNDKIAIVASARKVSKEELQPAIELFKSWGLEVLLSENLFKEEHQFSGSDNERAKDLQTMFDDESVKAVICARGGYGTLRIIDKIDFSEFKKH
ncbi:MAG: LD-carboxypeptidase, partial [Bacteroidia bacterium]